MRRSWFVAGLWVAAGCGTEPSGVLTITLNDLPEFTSERTITVAGTVTRTPAFETPIVVAVAGGQQSVSDTVQGSFSFQIGIAANAETQLAVTASDGTGSISEPSIVVIIHDDTGPQVATSVPTNEGTNVPLNTAIEIRFGEPLVQTGSSASFVLTQNSRAVPGTATLSGDKTFVTFEPDQILEPFSIYEMVIRGFTDGAGNAVGDGRNFCFITTSEGLQTTVTTDTSNTFFTGSTEAVVLQTPNIIGATLARGGSTLYGIFEFAARRSLLGETDKVSIFMDIDIDDDPNTGFQTFKDFQLSSDDFNDFKTGLGAELVVSLDAHVVDDSAFVGVTTTDDPGPTWDEIDIFLPGVCGTFFGFHTTTIFGDSIQDQGRFSYAYSAFVIENPTDSLSAVFMDPVPLAGHFDAELTDPGTPALLRLAAPRPQSHPQRAEAAYWRILRLLRSR